MSEFSGFPAETRQFLSDLRENNDRDWFNANKKRYEKFVKIPSVAFVQVMGTRLQDIDEKLVVDARTNGSGNLMRMARDTRFSADKSPYKSNIAMMWWHGSGKKTAHPAFGMQVTPDDAGLMAGMFGFDKGMLDAYRQAVDDAELGEQLVEAVQNVESAGYEMQGAHYKTTPRGYDNDHPRADLLKYNALYAHALTINWDVVMSPELVDVVYEHCQKLAPIQSWLVTVQETYHLS